MIGGDEIRRACRPSQARHRDGPLGARRAAGRRLRWSASRAISPLRIVIAIHRAADRALRRGDERVTPSRESRREQRGALAIPPLVRAARCGIRSTASRPSAPSAATARARARTDGERGRPRPAAASRREHGLGRTSSPMRDTWIGIVPVGYEDGFRRDLTGTEVRVAARLPRGRRDLDGRGGGAARPRRPGRSARRAARPGVLAEAHARVAGTITYELACGIGSVPPGPPDGDRWRRPVPTASPQRGPRGREAGRRRGGAGRRGASLCPPNGDERRSTGRGRRRACLRASAPRPGGRRRGRRPGLLELARERAAASQRQLRRG